MRRARALSETDRAIWASYSRLVSRMPGVVAVEVAVAAPLKVEAVRVEAAIVAKPMQGVRAGAVQAGAGRVPLVVGDSPGGVDRGTWTRFRTGKLAAARTLDLHGRTAQRAHAALEHFLHSCAAEGVRCVEVITGGGAGRRAG